MDFQFTPFDPPAALKPILRQTFFAKGQIHYRSDKILPNGLVVLIFCLGGPHRLGKSEDPSQNSSFAHNWLSGVQTTPLYNTPSSETHVMGLLFEPIGFHSLFGIDMRHLVDQTMGARDVLLHEIVQKIRLTLPQASLEAGHDQLHELLASMPKSLPPGWLQNLYDKIKASLGALKLTEAYQEIGLSARHVSDTFKTHVGVSPKVLCRIYRLEALLEQIDPATPVNWSTLAHEFGFTDQAHFNKEFRTFSGLQPKEYLEQRRRDLPELAKGESVHFAPQR